jgi:hypothetical protein
LLLHIDLHIRKAWIKHQEGPYLLKPRDAYREEFRIHVQGDDGTKCDNNCGVTYKVSLTLELKSGHVDGNQLQLEYTHKDGTIYYDFSFVDFSRNLGYRHGDASNCPAWKDGIKIDGQVKPHAFGCSNELECQPGTECMYVYNPFSSLHTFKSLTNLTSFPDRGGYYIDDPVNWGYRDPVRTCPTTEMELYFRLCSSKPEIRKLH